MQPFVEHVNFLDGMSMDERNNVYASSNLGITAYDPGGNRIFNVPTGGGATNVVFGDSNNKLLFITGGGVGSSSPDRVTSLKMNVKGVEKF